METFIDHLVFYWPPLLVCGGGVLLVGVFLCLHFFQKKMVIRWLAKYIFRDQLMAEKSAENLFNLLAGLIVTVGILWIIHHRTLFEF